MVGLVNAKLSRKLIRNCIIYDVLHYSGQENVHLYSPQFNDSHPHTRYQNAIQI